MSELRAIGEACGFTSVRTFIASGNLLFESDHGEAEVRTEIEQRLEAFIGKHVPVFVRSAAEMAAVVAANPFEDDKASSVMAHFIAEALEPAMLDAASGVTSERMSLGPRMIYVSYGEGIGQTRLKLPAIKLGTARNMNSVAKIAEMLT